MLGRRATTDLEKRLSYRFKQRELLERALTHRSRANEEGHEEHYERLEFLGDAVLGLVAGDWLYRRHRDLPEGELSKRKAVLVSRAALAQHAELLGLGAALRLGVGEQRSGGDRKPSLLADSLEAIFGAIYLDGGLAPAQRVIEAMLVATAPVEAEESNAVFVDAKSSLQEELQARGQPLPDYRLVETAGPDHDRTFTVECWVAGERAGSGQGSSKKVAEQRAAAAALAWWRGRAGDEGPRG